MPEKNEIKAPKGVLRRKFRCPQPSPSYVVPRRFAEGVGADGTWDVCLVGAAGGYGKTSLLAYWYRMAESSPTGFPLWISLDETDRNGKLFLRGLAYLFASVNLGFSSIIDNDDMDEQMLLIELCNKIDEYLDHETSYYLFLDNYDKASSDAFDEAILFIGKNTDDNLKIIMGATSFSPRLADLMFSSSVIALNSKDLRPGKEEVLRLAHSLMPSLGEEELEGMYLDYGNWPLVYSFASLACSRPAMEGSLNATVESYCARHFASSVFDVVDKETKRFLVETSIFEVLVSDVCDEVCGFSDSSQKLRWLQDMSYYCWYEESVGGYVYEPMFRKFLLGRLSEGDPSAIARLSAVASEVYARRGRPEMRAKYLAASSDPFYLKGSIEGSSSLTVGMETSDMPLFYLLEPAKGFESEPLLIWSAVWSFVAVGAVKEAERFISLPPLHGDTDTQNSYTYALAICRALDGDSKTSLEIIESILKKEGDNLPRVFQCMLIHMEGEDYERLGDPKQGRELYKKALSLAERTGSFYSMFDLYLLAHQHLLLGDLDKARSFALTGQRESGAGSVLYGEFCAIEAAVSIERGDLEEAAPLVKRALMLVTPQSNIDMYIDANVHAARFQQAKGNFSEAVQLLTDVIKNVEGKRVPRNLQIEAHGARIGIALETDDFSAIRESEAVLDDFGANSDVLRTLQAAVAKIKVLLRMEDFAALPDLIEKARELNESARSRYYSVNLQILEAAFMAASGRSDKALPIAISALEGAMRSGYLMIFAEGGSLTRSLLVQVAAKQKASTAIRDYAKKALACIDRGRSIMDAELPVAPTGISTLTSREREILRMLNQGMTRFEIATMLSLSQNTVKSHLKNIYSKLGAHSREDVFEVCQEMGIS